LFIRVPQAIRKNFLTEEPRADRGGKEEDRAHLRKWSTRPLWEKEIWGEGPLRWFGTGKTTISLTEGAACGFKGERNAEGRPAGGGFWLKDRKILWVFWGRGVPRKESW